jgi:F0F1-type ATP synthase assembly protein I
VWVLSVAPISLVATYAYVNPVVAVFLGWLILSEAVTLPILVGGAIVVGAVAVVVSAERQTSRNAAKAVAGKGSGDGRLDEGDDLLLDLRAPLQQREG